MARSFNGSSGIVTTALTAHNTLRSYSIWGLFNSSGEATKGRLFDKASSGSLVERLQIEGDDTPDTITYCREWSGATAAWGFNIPTSGQWLHFGLTYDSGLVGNDPIFYLNGVSQTLTKDINQSAGTPDTNAAGYQIGNRDTDDRTWDGFLAEFAVWNVILSAGEMAQIAAGGLSTPLGIQAANLAAYYKLLSTDLSDASGHVADATQSGTTVVAGPHDNPPATSTLIPGSIRSHLSGF